MGFLKGKSSILIHETRKSEIQIWEPEFLVAGLLRRQRGKNTKKIAEYIQNQLKEDELHDQLTLKEYTDPFTGSSNPFAGVRPQNALQALLSIRALQAFLEATGYAGGYLLRKPCLHIGLGPLCSLLLKFR